MATTFDRNPALDANYEIVPVDGGFTVTVDGETELNRIGVARVFISRNSARKRISRLRNGTTR